MRTSTIVIFSVVLFTLWTAFLGPIPVDAADTLLDETVTVSAGTYRYYSFNMNFDNVKLFLAIDVLSGNNINVHVLDAVNFDKWTEGESVPAYLSRQKMGSVTADVTLGAKGKYYVISDNSYSLITDKLVHITLEAESVEAESATFLFLGFIFLAVLGGAGGLAIMIYLIWKSQTKKDRYQPPVTHPPTQIPHSSEIFCPNCGNPLDHVGTFCMNCGQKILRL